MERVTAPFQYAMTTRAGNGVCCAGSSSSHGGQPQRNSHVVGRRVSVRSDIAESDAGKFGIPGGAGFAIRASYLWGGDSGVRTIKQGEGGEQGDAMMPLSFSLGQHAALHAVQGRLEAGERLFAFLDDIWVVTAPDSVGPAYTAIREALWEHSRIRVHVGKTKVWNSGGILPVTCDMLERIVRENNPDILEVRVWRGGCSI